MPSSTVAVARECTASAVNAMPAASAHAYPSLRRSPLHHRDAFATPDGMSFRVAFPENRVFFFVFSTPFVEGEIRYPAGGAASGLGMGRFSRVKGGSNRKSEVPDLEAHFPDGAWYDIVLRAADPSRDRFLVQARDFPDEEEWLEADRVRLQSQPYEDPPKKGSVVLALHRAARSDLFFEGVVMELGPSSCKVKFTEGRAKGQTMECGLDDINKINTKKCSSDDLRRWCPKKAGKAGATGEAGQVVAFDAGAFVLIEGPDDSCWVAQLLEPYVGKLSEEVDDVDDDGPRISLRWLYTPDELPNNVLKGTSFEKEHEVFLSFHKDEIDARLIKGKCGCAFGLSRPKANFKWKKDMMFSYRAWDPVKKKITALDCPNLSVEFRSEVESLVRNFPYPVAARADKGKEPESASGTGAAAESGSSDREGEKTPRLREPSRRHSDETGHTITASTEVADVDGKRGRKGRSSLESTEVKEEGKKEEVKKAVSRGGAFKTEEPPAVEGEASGDRRKSARGGTGFEDGVAADTLCSNDAEALFGPRRRGKGALAVGEDLSQDEPRAELARKGRSSKASDLLVFDSKEEKREPKDVRDMKEEGGGAGSKKSHKRKSDGAESKGERPASGDELVEDLSDDRTKQKEVEAKKEADAQDEKPLEKKSHKKGKSHKKQEKKEDDERKDAKKAMAENEKSEGEKLVDNSAENEKDADDEEEEDDERKKKEKKRGSKGSSELAALQADVSNSDMLSNIHESTGKRKSVPATYFTYDPTGNQSEVPI